MSIAVASPIIALFEDRPKQGMVYQLNLSVYLDARVVFVSSIKELARRWYPRAYFNAPAKDGGHRALADIRESIEELRYYREAVFVPRPGPGNAALRVMSARHRGAIERASETPA